MQRTLVLLSFCFLIFLSCEEDSKVSFEELTINTSSNTDVEINIPKAIGNETISNAINSKIANQVIYSLHIGESNKIRSNSIEESIETFNEEFNSFKKDFPDSRQNWEAQIDGEVMYQSHDIISVAITSYVNTGGAHGNLNISFLNFNAITGDLLSFSNIFNDNGRFKEIAKTYFKKVIKNKEDQYFEANSFSLPANIGYNYQGIILLYNVYEIAPYATGITEFTIPFEEVQSIINFD